MQDVFVGEAFGEGLELGSHKDSGHGVESDGRGKSQRDHLSLLAERFVMWTGLVPLGRAPSLLQAEEETNPSAAVTWRLPQRDGSWYTPLS